MKMEWSMIDKKKKTGNRRAALLLSAVLAFHSVPLNGSVYAGSDVGKDISWSQEAVDAAKAKMYLPTGLSYRTSTSGIKPEYAYMGEKQYLHGSGGAFSEFINRYIYCINMHKDNGGKLLWDAQAFLTGKYNINALPSTIITGVSEEQKKFNFLMLVYATSYESKQEAATLMGNANVGVDVLTVCVQLTQGAADYAAFTGKWEDDFNWFKNNAYPRALDAVGPTNTLGDATTYKQLTSADIPQWTKDKGCENRAQAIFAYVWTAAKLSAHLQIENNRDTWRFEAVAEEDGLYHVRIPFDGDNQYILEYLRMIQPECYGDWQRQDDAACLHLISPSGLVPSEGSIACLTSAGGEGMIARNLSEAELYEFKFYSVNNQGKKGFDNIQTYFSSVMDQPLEIYLQLGGAPSVAGGANVQRLEHKESWNADYNVNLIKYDAETGKTLEGAHFDILEKFDDSQLEHTELDESASHDPAASIGSLNATTWGDDDIASNYSGDMGLLHTDNLTYNWANDHGSQFGRWNDPEEDLCIQDDEVTDNRGHLMYQNGAGEPSGDEAHFDVRSYIYHKGYCTGHPAPVIEYEELSETDGEAEGEDESEVEAYNQQIHDAAWAAWYAEVETCGTLAGEGGFFHAIDPNLAKAAMEEDRNRFYEDFISLTYDYSAKEIMARKGYILHDIHNDDIPIEWRTVTSSQYKNSHNFAQNSVRNSAQSSFQNPEDTLVKMGTASDAERLEIVEDEEEYEETDSFGEATPAEAIRRNMILTGFMKLAEAVELPSFLQMKHADSAPIRDSISFQPSDVLEVIPGANDTLDWTFHVHDHRTEGMVHINKQDLDLNKGKNDRYESYGDTQGDGTLEGAVYGLFAAADLVHPDGKTGVVFQKDNLVSIATTDKNGDASFLAVTEPPGTIFDFNAGKTTHTGFKGPTNLITENEKNNGNVWIGRPLIISQEGSCYYIMELARSEGYELSRYGIDAEVTNREADAAGTFPSTTGMVTSSELQMNRKEGYNQCSIHSKGTENGYDILISGLHAGAKFYATETKVVINPEGTHTESISIKNPVYGVVGSPVIIDGTMIEASVGDVITLPNGTTSTVRTISKAKEQRLGVRPGNAFQVIPPILTGADEPAVEADFINKVNGDLKRAGYKATEKNSPWVSVQLLGTTEAEWCHSLNDALMDLKVFNAISIEDVYRDGEKMYGLLRYTYLQAGAVISALYDEDSSSLWVKKSILYEIEGESIEGYLYHEYPVGEYEDIVQNPAGFITSATVMRQSLTRPTAKWKEDLSLIGVRDEVGKTYWVYGEAEQACDNRGNLIYSTHSENREVAPGYEKNVIDTPLPYTYDESSKNYTIHITPGQTPKEEKLDVKIRYDTEFIENTNQAYTDYVQTHACVSAFPSMIYHSSYIANILLIYPGQDTVFQDGGTGIHPLTVFERAIRQKVKIVKDIKIGKIADSTTKLDNFRFKIYLKSNLERLYRDETGGVDWLDRGGAAIAIREYQSAYPQWENFGSVPKLYTRVPHNIDSNTTGSISNNVWETAVTVNQSLYSYGVNGMIEENQNSGYTRILETQGAPGSGYNYEKFFDGIKTTNTHDSIRQFAITWYLDDEVKKLVKDNGRGENQAAAGSETYQDEIYDQALKYATDKAKNYLKPFFTYELDRIYAIEWDSESEGGFDKDPTTLSADILYPKGDYYYGVSKYLPYGVYVAVEQQPCRAELRDFYNKHYKINQPKEIILPSVYEAGGNIGSDEILHAAYHYSSKDKPEDLQRKYYLRFNEEWPNYHGDDWRSYVIRGHNHDGDYEIYKYGLEPDKRTGSTYHGFSIAQEINDPYKDIYEKENASSDYHSNQKIESYYHYGSLSEQSGSGTSMTGVLTAEEGNYASALVPWTVTEPMDAGIYDAENFNGYADGTYHNVFYSTKLRIEKLDSETGENILHEGALFTIYKAAREEVRTGNGWVKFYERDTVITGTKEFLEAMGAVNITPRARRALPWEVPYRGLYYGTVSAGTPICKEKEPIILLDSEGKKTGSFLAYSTTNDIEQVDGEEAALKSFEDQNTGYLETPQPLGAGCYVIAEIKPPSGYVRSKPVAIEIYSDQVTYYMDGNRDRRVRSPIYEYDISKENDVGETARVSIHNPPICLEVSKVKPDEKLMNFELVGRREGSLIELQAAYGLENMELAYNASKKFLGYGWKKGFLDSLKAKQAAGESIEILYEDGVFTGNARLYKVPQAADDLNRHLPGATMTLYDAIEIKENGDREDYRYDGVNIKRDTYGNINRMYVQKGYAGTQLKYVLDKTNSGGETEEEDKQYNWNQQEDDKGTGIWTYRTVEREDTDILFYDIKNTAVLQKEGALLYHLDSDGNRDSLVDPYTGMAYLIEESSGKILVWPVEESGEKIKTGRIATIGSDAEKEFTIGSYHSGGEGEMGQGSFKQQVNPTLDRHGLPIYYQKSKETYLKGVPIYDRDGDYVRYKYDDRLKAYNDNAYCIEINKNRKDIGFDVTSPLDDKKLYHRLGEGHLIENTWTTGEKTPNDPFTKGMTAGQADRLKRIPVGTYILEELKAPEGYVKTMPVAMTVKDDTRVQTVRAIDQVISTYFEKTDAPNDYRIKVLDKDKILSKKQLRKQTEMGTITEGKGGYTYTNVVGAKLVLFRAIRVKTDDKINYPSGYYLKKTETIQASWTTDAVPMFMETIPKGFYILEEISAPSGYIRNSMEVEVKETGKLQQYLLPNDHTKLEIFKYREDKNGEKIPLDNENPAELALYEAVTDANGIVMEDGIPKFHKDKPVDIWKTDDCKEYTEMKRKSFIHHYQKLFQEYGTEFNSISWGMGRTANRMTSVHTDQKESVTQLWNTDRGSHILINVTKNMTSNGKLDYVYDYRFNYKKLNTDAYPNAVSYDTISGNHRIDYLPHSSFYVLDEIKAPNGFADVVPKAIAVDEVADIQLYSLKNEPKYLYLSKVSEDGIKLKGAELALYRAAEDGSLKMDSIHLFAKWISTTEDVKLSPVPYGTYYLVELTAPNGYMNMEPQKIEVTEQSNPQIQAVNHLKKGIVRIEKVDAENPEIKLGGAKFRVVNQETGEEEILVTSETGRAESQLLTIGKTGIDGIFLPYHFTIHEIMPPNRYTLNLSVHHFQFTDYGTDVTLHYDYGRTNRQTEIFISKSDFNRDTFLKGAKLAVFGTRAVNGKYEIDGDALEEWTSGGGRHLIKGKLSAGGIYLLKELQAPEGYALSEPMLFTISDDGRKLVHVTNNLNIVEFHMSGSYADAIESVSILGRRAIATKTELKDLDTGVGLPIDIQSNIPLTAKDGIREGHLYEQREVTYYTDGNSQISRRSIFRMVLDDNGNYLTSIREPKKTQLQIQTSEQEAPKDIQNIVDTWDVENTVHSGYAHTIFNPEYETKQSVHVISENGRYGSGVMPGSIVKYQIAYKNTTKEKLNMRAAVILDSRTEYMPTSSTIGGKEEGQRVSWLMPNILPGESGTIIFTTAIKDDFSLAEKNTDKIEHGIVISENKNTIEIRVMNPLTKSGGITVVNQVSGTAAETLLNGNREFTYRIFLKNAEGEALIGAYPYSGSKQGFIKSGDCVSFSGNEFITLRGMAWGTRYLVQQIAPDPLLSETPEDNIESSSVNAEGISGREGVTAVFLNRKNDPSIREIFKKDETYHLTETTYYTDGSREISDKMSFTLNENTSADHVDMKDKPTHVVINKTNITGTEELIGATFELRELSGLIVESWISNGKPHEIIGKLRSGGTYILVETIAPDGYLTAAPMVFTVSKNGVMDQITVKNKKIPEGPIIPEEPKVPNRPIHPIIPNPPVPKVGTITVKYDRQLWGTGHVRVEKRKIGRIPAAGEERNHLNEIVICILLFCFIIFLIRKNQSRKMDESKKNIKKV
ncbi:MAG: SpaA isopeptide-forming pilin-related protein [Clostridium sp.]